MVNGRSATFEDKQTIHEITRSYTNPFFVKFRGSFYLAKALTAKLGHFPHMGLLNPSPASPVAFLSTTTDNSVRCYLSSGFDKIKVAEKVS
jgi:hypothetical protein